MHDCVFQNKLYKKMKYYKQPKLHSRSSERHIVLFYEMVAMKKCSTVQMFMR